MDLEQMRKQIKQEILSEDIRKEEENIMLLAAMEKFNKANKINQNPPKSILKKENGYWSLPISWVEAKLRKIYLGKVQWLNFHWQTLGNEIVGTITLRVFHPVLREWLEYTGAAAKMIQQRKTTDGNATPLDQWEIYKYSNGLEKTFPALQSMCKKSAVKSIGKCFGSDINRKNDKVSEEKEVLQPIAQVQVFEAIKAAGRDVAAINGIINEYPHVSKFPECVGMITVARALAQCNSGGEISKLAHTRGWKGKFDNIIKLYKGE